MSANPRLSLCMIVRDEERWITGCLNSVRDIVDEMIVVDTGSTDATPDLAAACGANVYIREWTDHFAEARNESIALATGDWILVLDADERLDEADRHAIRELVASDKWIASLPVLNYYGEDPPDPARTNRLRQFRLFRNAPNLRFQNAIHEQLVRIPELTEDAAAHLPTVIHHYGYMDEPVRQKQKSRRNLRLLEQAIRQTRDDDPWLEYHMASEWYRLGRFDRALALLNRAVIRCLLRNELPPSLFYRLKYATLIEAGRWREAASGIDAALALYPDYVDLHLYKGIILLKLDEPAEALKSFEHCLRLGDGNLAHLTSFGAGSYQAWHYIGRCHLQLGDEDRAQDAFRKALELAPTFMEAAERLRELQGKEE